MLRRNRPRLPPGLLEPTQKEELFGGAKEIPPVGPGFQVPRFVGESSLAEIPRPIPWEKNNLLAVGPNFTVNVERDVIGGASAEVPSVGPVPLGMRGIIDFFEPVAIDAFGYPVDVFPSSGTTVVWRVYGDNRLLRNFEAYGAIPYRKEMGGRSLSELLAGQVVRVSVTLVANGMGLAQLGARISGWWEPLDLDQAKRAKLQAEEETSGRR